MIDAMGTIKLIQKMGFENMHPSFQKAFSFLMQT